MDPFGEAYADVVGLCVLIYWGTKDDSRGVPFEKLMGRFETVKRLQWCLGVLQDIGMVQEDLGRFLCTVEPEVKHFGSLWALKGV